MMDKKDAIDYLLYMKHDVQAGSPVDVAIDTAIEALKATVKQTKTNADRIRQMTDDEELLSAIGMSCYRCVYNNSGKCSCECNNGCYAGNLEWLRKEADEDATERTD